jgi:signal transduction histidine kinase
MDLESLWLAALQEVAGRAAHEVKNALNGVHLNLEAIRSRAAKKGATMPELSGFVGAAADQLDMLTERTESLLFLARPHRSAAPADVGLTLRHLATLLVPAAKANGGTLEVEGSNQSVPTLAPALATRLALAAALLSLTKEGGVARCRLETPVSGAADGGTVVRFSHESARTCSIEPEIATAIGEHQIRTERSGSDLLIVFPGT